MREILQVQPFEEIEGVIIDSEIRAFGSRTVLFLNFKKNDGQIVELLLSDIAVHLLGGVFSKLKGKKAKIRPACPETESLITLLD